MGKLEGDWDTQGNLGNKIALGTELGYNKRHTRTHSSEAAPCKVMAIPVCSQLKSSPSRCSASRIQNVDLSQEEDQKQGLKDWKGEVTCARYGGDLTIARNSGGFLAYRMTADVKLPYQLSHKCQLGGWWLMEHRGGGFGRSRHTQIKVIQTHQRDTALTTAN